MRTVNFLIAAILVASFWGCGNNSNQADTPSDKDSLSNNGQISENGLPADTLKKHFIRAGELEFSGENIAEVHTYFDTTNFQFHGPDGRESNYAELTEYFKSYRAAFDNRSIRRGLIVTEGNYISCQTWIEGKFVREFTQSPVGKLPPNGKRVVYEIINIFRFDDQGRIVEEWVQGDSRSYLRQLGAEGK